MQADGLSFAFVDRLGLTRASVPMPNFFGIDQSPGFVTYDADPQVYFDTIRQRWIATEVSWDCATYALDHAPTYGHGFIDYAISNTADPEGTWAEDFWYWDDYVPDQPAFGSSTDKLGLTTNLYAMGPGGGIADPGCASGAFIGSQVGMMDWAQLGPKFDTSNVVGTWFGNATPDERFALQEPITSPELRLILTDTGTTPTDVNYVDFTGSAVLDTVDFTAYDLTTDGVVPQFLAPPSPHQPGGSGLLTSSPMTGDPDSVIYRNGTLAFSSTYPCTPTGDVIVRDCVRVVTLASPDQAAEPSRLGDTLIGTSGFDDSFGGITWSGSGVLHVAYTRSSASSDASSFEQYNRPNDTSIAWSMAQPLTAGAGSYAGQAWGAAPQMATDPQDQYSVWVGDPYAAADGHWATSIHELTVGGGGDGYTPITPFRVLDSRIGTGLSGALETGVPRTFAVAGFRSSGGLLAIPPDAVAITGNLTVTDQTAAGYVSLTPNPTTNPASSTINFPLGDTRANNVTIALGPAGTLSAVYKASAGGRTDLILDVTGFFEAGSGQTYNPISSTRMLDSRLNLGAARFAVNQAETIPIAGVMITPPGGSPFIPVPTGATAITANLTVVGQTKAGYVSLTPTPTNSPATSTINFPLADVRANGLSIAIDPITGDVSAVYKAQAGAHVDLVLDVTGYYTASGGLLFHPLNPGRRLDTRLPLGLNGMGNALSGAQGTAMRDFLIGEHFGVVSGAAAITGNLTITGQTGAGYVALTDASVALPTTSTINFPIGDTRANGITAALGGGDLWLVYERQTSKTVQVIIDITGYFE